MNMRIFIRWTVSIVIAFGIIGAIGLALNPSVQARVNTVHVWPGGLLPACNTPSLQQCLDAAAVSPGDVVRIRPGEYTQSVTLAKSVSLIGDDPSTTILYALPRQRVLTVAGEITFSTLISGLTFAGGNLTSDACLDGCGGGILISGAARPTLQNIVLRENHAWQGGGLWVDAGPEVLIVNSKIISNSTVHAGGGLYSAADVRLVNTFIERNQSNDNGGGLEVVGSLNVTNGSVFGNTSVNGGGGARVAALATLNYGRWEGNTTGGFGGGLYASNLILTGTLFTNNVGDYYGGGVYINGPAQLSGGRFERNRATGGGGGGGLYAGELHAIGTQFFSNTATGSSTAYGGGAYIAAGIADLTQVRFEGNAVGGAGGGLYVSGPVMLTGSDLVNNSADMASGGGVYAGGDLVIKNSRLENNISRFGSGGGAYAQNPVVVADSTFVSNSASLQGGGLAGIEGAVVQGSQFLRNSSTQSGGGLDVAGSLGITGSVFISNSSLIGGGVYHNGAGNGRVVNSLFARNLASETYAAALQLAAQGNVDVIHTTIADPSGPLNPAAAIRVESGDLNIVDTIIADHAFGIYNNGGVAFEDYSLFSNVGTLTFGTVITGGHEFYVAPQFVDPAADDYHLRFTSPAINIGTNAGINFDFDGQPRPIGPGFDIGFDETGSSIQELIDFTPPGGVVSIPDGVYVESLNLYKPVSLIGAGNTATIIQAVAGNRVLTATGPLTMATHIANLTLTNGNVSGGGFERAGGGVLITDTAYPSFNNVQIVGNNADYGGGLYVYSGGAILHDTVIANNHANQSGGGVYVVEPATVLEQLGGAIQDNTAIDGAGVFVQSGQFRQNGGVILRNTATRWGGGLLVGSGGSIRTDSVQIVDNDAQNAGGGVFVDVGSAELFDSLIMSNTASEGGGLYVREFTGTTASVVGGKVESNAANGYGGGVYAGGTLYITGTRFFDNGAYDGSALEITGTARARVVNAFIAGNAAFGAFPSTNSSVRFDSSNSSVVLNTTLGNATQPLTRALAVNNGVVYVVNTIVASYTNGLSQFGGQLTEDYNLFFGTAITASGSISHGGHSLFGPDPLFKNPSADDYHVKGLSPAVNRGTNAGVRRDIDQDARPLGGAFDIGADEASVASTIVGSNIGGSFTYTTMQNSTINVDVPAGAVTQTAAIYCSLIDTTTLQPPRSFKFVGTVFELDANVDLVNVLPGSIVFSVPVTLSVSYTDQQLAAAGITDELEVKLYRLETPPFGTGWCEVGVCRPGESQVQDTQNNVITATVLGFSRWGQASASGAYELFLPLILKG
jgi:hypothetical protein